MNPTEQSSGFHHDDCDSWKPEGTSNFTLGDYHQPPVPAYTPFGQLPEQESIMNWPNPLATDGQALDQQQQYPDGLAAFNVDQALANDQWDPNWDTYRSQAAMDPGLREGTGHDEADVHTALESYPSLAVRDGVQPIDAPNAGSASSLVQQRIYAQPPAAPAFSGFDFDNAGGHEPDSLAHRPSDQDDDNGMSPLDNGDEEQDESDSGEDDETPKPKSKAKVKDPRKQCDKTATCTRPGRRIDGMYGGRKLCTRHGEAWEIEHGGPPNWDVDPVEPEHALAWIRRHVEPPKQYRGAVNNDKTLALHRAQGKEWTDRFFRAAMTPYEGEGEDRSDPYLLVKHQKTLNGNAIRRRKDQYSNFSVSARISLLFHIALRYHVGGPAIYGEGGDNVGYKENTKLTFEERLQLIETTLRDNKRVLMDVIEGRGVEAFVRGPEEYAKRKTTNKQGNMARTVKNTTPDGSDDHGTTELETAVATLDAGDQDIKPGIGEPSQPTKQTMGRKRKPKEDAEGNDNMVPAPPTTRKKRAHATAPPSPPPQHIDPQLLQLGQFPTLTMPQPTVPLPWAEGRQLTPRPGFSPGGLSQQRQPRADGRHFYGPDPTVAATPTPSAAQQQPAMPSNMTQIVTEYERNLMQMQWRWNAANQAVIMQQGNAASPMAPALPVPALRNYGMNNAAMGRRGVGNGGTGGNGKVSSGQSQDFVDGRWQ